MIGVGFHDLANDVSGLSNSIDAQSDAQLIPSYDGDPTKFKDWIKNIEKHAIVCNLPLEKVKLVQTSTGCVSSFLKRVIINNEDITWPALKAELDTKFPEINDSHYAFQQLSEVKQKADGTVQMFGELLLNLAEEACIVNQVKFKFIDINL